MNILTDLKVFKLFCVVWSDVYLSVFHSAASAMPISYSSYYIHMISQKRSARRVELRKCIFQNTENFTDTFGWHHWGSIQQGCSHPQIALFCLTTLWASLADCSTLFKLWSGQETIFVNLTSLSFLVFTVSLGFPPGEPLAGLASLQLGSAGVLPLPDGQAEGLRPTAGCGLCDCHGPATELGVQLRGAERLEWTPGTGTPLCCGAGVDERLQVGAAFPRALWDTTDMAARELSCPILLALQKTRDF